MLHRDLSDLLGAALLRSPWLDRLGRISFLGTLDFHPRSARASSRLDHSLGVADLGLQVGRALELPPDLLRPFVAACLLHDIGHFPLSHAAEAGFSRALGVAHHEVSEWIVRGTGAIPERLSLRPTLLGAGLDPELVWGIIRGRAEGPFADLARLLLAPINLDTLDGIVRTARAFRRPGLRLPRPLLRREGDDIVLAPDALPVLDRFWRLKDVIYCEVINLPSNIVCEAELSDAVATSFAGDVFERFAEFDDDALHALAADHAERSGLAAGRDDRFQTTRAPPHTTPAAVPRVRKRYYVDPAAGPGPRGLPLREWGRRYRHARQLAFVSARAAAAQLALPGLLEDHVSDDMSTWPPLPPGAEGPEI